VRDSSNTLRIFADGVQLYSIGISTFTFFDSSSSLVLGARYSIYEIALNGYLDDVRITKGVGRYTANFTPPAQAFSDP
jgi:hypothetical protein